MKLSDQITRRQLFVAFGTSSQTGSLSSVDLAATRDDSSVALTASDGSVAPIAGADALVAGVMTAADKVRLDNLPPTTTRDFGILSEVSGATVGTAITHLRTGGHFASGDGGGALYKRTDQNAEPSHAFKVQSADGAWWEGVPNPEGVNPYQLGAKGDGSADDTTALANAASIDAALVIPAGTFRVAGTVSLPADKTVRGLGGTVFVDPSADYPGAFDVTGNGVEIIGVHFKGNGVSRGIATHETQPGGAAIKGDAVENLKITGCTFEDFKIDNSVDIEAGVVSLISSRGLQIIGNSFAASNSGGVDIALSRRVGDVEVIGNYSRSGADIFCYAATVGGSESVDASSVIEKTAHHVIQGNIVVKAGGRHGILVHYNGGYSYATITGNIIVGAGRHGIYLRGDSTTGGDTGPNVVSGNIIRFCGGTESQSSYWGYNNGIQIECTLPSVVTDNIIEKAGYHPDGTARPNRAAGIGFSRAVRDMRIAGNRIKGCRGPGIAIAPTSAPASGYSAERVEIVGNHIRDCEVCGLSVTDRNAGTLRWVNVRGNVIVIASGTAIGIAIYLGSAQTMHVTDNTVIGAGAASDQTGIAFHGGSEGKRLCIRQNQIEACQRGVASRAINGVGGDGGANFTAHRVIGTTVWIDENDFIDCGEAVIANNSASDELNYVGPRNGFIGTTKRPNSTVVGWNRVVVGEPIGFDHWDTTANVLVELHVTVIPAGGAYYVGDRIKQRAPVAGGKSGAVCVTAGSPGTWKEYGVIDA